VYDWENNFPWDFTWTQTKINVSHLWCCFRSVPKYPKLLLNFVWHLIDEISLICFLQISRIDLWDWQHPNFVQLTYSDGIMNSLEYNRICQLTTRESYEVISQFAYMCGVACSLFIYKTPINYTAIEDFYINNWRSS